MAASPGIAPGHPVSETGALLIMQRGIKPMMCEYLWLIVLRALDTVGLICHHFRMGFFGRIFRRKRTFAMQPSDLKMWQASTATGIKPSCECFGVHQNGKKECGKELSFHEEAQDTTCQAWKSLKLLIEKAAAEGTLEFAPGLEMPPEQWAQIITLPSSIGKLTSVKKLYLYGSHLVRIPEEIGNMSNLEELDLYTSYRLHWLPFEVTRCLKLKRSRFSTRALYGNYKYRSPFPKLDCPDPNIVPEFARCSICNSSVPRGKLLQAWISLRVGTDVLPLLVNACSNECIRRLPAPADGYVDHSHRGGLDLIQPAAR